MTLTLISKPQKPRSNPIDRRMYKKIISIGRLATSQSRFGVLRVHSSIVTPIVQTKLKIGEPNDKFEQEADRVADRVMGMPDSQVQRQVDSMETGQSIPAKFEEPVIQRMTDEDEDMVQTKLAVDTIQRMCSKCEEEEKLQRVEMEEEEEILQTKSGSDQGSTVTPSIHSGINWLRQSGGVALPESTRAFMEPRFGRDFNKVKLHTSPQASVLSQNLNARAFTVGRDIFFNQGEFQPHTSSGMRLLAHELTHTVQQSPSTQGFKSVISRQVKSPDYKELDDPRVHPNEAPKAKSCTPPSQCPKHFCQPYSSESYAKHQRSKMALTLMAGIALAVDSRVVPLWLNYLWGGRPPQDLTSKFGKDFANSPTTKTTTNFLIGRLKASLLANPPSFPSSHPIVINFASRISSSLDAIDDPASRNRMNFDFPKDVAGNLAGDIGKDQTACKAGAQPSPFNDERIVEGIATVIPDGSGNLSVHPSITYTVKDTIDLCPGNCGTAELEQFATVIMSQFEATGISGDVPFTVEFNVSPPPFTIPDRAISKP